MIQYIYDFLSVLFDKIKEKEKINSIILFGSFARGNPRKDSDIDIFIDIKKDKKEIEPIIKEALNEFELKASRSWHLKGIKNPINAIIDDINKEQWKELRNEVSAYGIILYGKYTESNNVIIEYNLSKLSQNKKMSIIRKLLGYKIMKSKKTYEVKGLLENIGAEKISNCILANEENSKQVIIILRKNNVQLKIRKV